MINEIKTELDGGKYEKYSVRKEKVCDINIEIVSINYLEAPVEKGRIIGSLELKIDGEVIENIKIRTCEEVRKKNISDYFFEIISDYDIILKNMMSRQNV